jgi:diguanylate cyclase
MSQPHKPYQSTIAIAETALEQIASRGQSAGPRSFELWYKFAAGDSGLLCAAVKSKLDRSGRLSDHDFNEIYDAHISPSGVSAKVDHLSACMATEIEQAAAMIEAAGGSASHYAANLSHASQRLAGIEDRGNLRAIIEKLIHAAKEMATTNLRLQDQFQSLWEEVSRLRRDVEATRAEGSIDALTGLANRNSFDAAFKQTVVDCHAENAAMAHLLIDVDNLKAINDSFGNVVGDRVLRFVAGAIKNNIAGKDLAARCGGGEFAVIMPRTPLRPAVEIADAIRAMVMKGELVRRSTGEKQTGVTVSIGVAALHERGLPQALLEAADLCLRAAKRNGRNCVIAENDERLVAALAG